MGINLDLHKIPNIKLVSAICSVFSSIIAPFFFLSQFNKIQFNSIDLIHQLLWATAIGFPLIMCFSLLYLFTNIDHKEKPDYSYTCIIIGSASTIGVLYLPFIWANHEIQTLKQAKSSAIHVFSGIFLSHMGFALGKMIYSIKTKKSNIPEISTGTLPHLPTDSQG